MTHEQRLEASIHNNLSILRAWADGRIKVTTGGDDIINSTYSLNTIINIMENNALEGITPPTQIIEKGEHRYEIFITIPDIRF